MADKRTADFRGGYGELRGGRGEERNGHFVSDACFEGLHHLCLGYTDGPDVCECRHHEREGH